MENKAQEALDTAKGLAKMVENMIKDADDLDLQRLLKQVEADRMDLQHKLSIAVRLSEKR